MFGRVLTKIFKRGTATVKAPIAKAPAEEAANPFGRHAAAPASAVAPPSPAPDKKASKSAEPHKKVAEGVKDQWKAKANKTFDAKASPESLCEINKSMPKEEIREKLAVLYRRHNRAASSLDAKMREESELMLEAIASLKEKYLGGK